MYVKLHFGKINTLYYTLIMSLSGKFVMLYSIFCTRELCWMRLYEIVPVTKVISFPFNTHRDTGYR